MMCIKIWGEGNGPWMQALHFAFGLGAFVAPLLAEPFLSTQQMQIQIFTNGSFSANTTMLPVIHDQNKTVLKRHDQMLLSDHFILPLHQHLAHSREKRQENGITPMSLTTGVDEDGYNVSETLSNGTGLTTLSVLSTGTLYPPKPKYAGKTSNNENGIADGSILHNVDNIKPAKDEPDIAKPPSDDAIDVNSNEAENMNSTNTEEDDLLVSTAADGSATITHTSTTPAATKATTTTTTTTTTTATTTTTTTSTTTTATSSTTILPQATSTSTKSMSATNRPGVPIDDVTAHIPHRPNKTGGSFRAKSVENLKKTVQDVAVSLQHRIRSFSKVQFAYLTIALYIFVVAVLFGVVCCSGGCSLRAHELYETETTGTKRTESKGFRCQTLVLLFIFYFLYVGMEVTYGGLLLAFTVKQLKWTKKQGTRVTSVFWGSFAASRGISIFIARCCSPTVMLIMDLVFTNVALAALVMTLDSHASVIWYASALLGFGMASIFPTGITWAERYMEVTGKSTAVFVIGSALGEMCMPALTGFLFEAKDPMWLLYVMLASAVVCIVVYIIMQNLASNSGVRYKELKSFKHSSLLNHEDHLDVEMRGVTTRSEFYDDDDDDTPLFVNSHKRKSNKRVTFDLTDDAKSARDRLRDKVNRSILKDKDKL